MAFPTYEDYLRSQGIDPATGLPTTGAPGSWGGPPAAPGGPTQVNEEPGRLPSATTPALASGPSPMQTTGAGTLFWPGQSPSPRTDRPLPGGGGTFVPQTVSRTGAPPARPAAPAGRSVSSGAPSTGAPRPASAVAGASTRQPFGAGFPFNRPKQDLSTLGSRIASTVKGAIAGNKPGPFDRPPFAGMGRGATPAVARQQTTGYPQATRGGVPNPNRPGRPVSQNPPVGRLPGAGVGQNRPAPQATPARAAGTAVNAQQPGSMVGTTPAPSRLRARGPTTPVAPAGTVPPANVAAQQPGGAPSAPAAPATTGATGTVGSFGDAGQDPTLDQYNQAYLDASSSTGVPANAIKGIHATENGWGGVQFGTQNCEVRPDAGCLNLWTGIFETTASAHGIDYQRTLTDPAYAIWSVGKVMGDIAADDSSAWGGPGGGTVLDQYGWGGVIDVYFSGSVGAGGWSDETGRSTGQYNSDVAAKIDTLGGIGAPATGAAAPPGAAVPGTQPPAGAFSPGGPGTDPAANPVGMRPEGQQLQAPSRSGVVGVATERGAFTAPISGLPMGDGIGVVGDPNSDRSYMDEMAPGGLVVSTDYKQRAPWGDAECMYCYQDGHGAATDVHAGYDLVCPAQDMSCYGTQLNSPVQGTVVCARGEGYVDPSGGFNCNYATDPQFEDNGYPGQVTIQTDPDSTGQPIYINMIHMSNISANPGDQVGAGDQVGNMGSDGGMAHVHMEAWGTCNGVYVYLDPTLVVDGYYDSHSACEGIA